MADNDDPSQTAAEEEQPDEILMSCRCESAKTLATLLQCLRHSSSDESSSRRSSAIQPVTVFVSRKSISFHVHGKAKQIQSSVDIQPSFFSDYHLGSHGNDTEINNNNSNTDVDDDGAFCVNLTTLLDCLHALGTSQSLAQTKVSLAYNTTTQVLKLELCGHQALTVAAIPGLHMDAAPDDDDDATPLSLAFRSSATTVRMILQSAVLRQVWTEVQYMTGATTGTIAMGKERGLELRVVGPLHACCITVPAVGSHVVALELAPHVATTTMSREYPLSSLKESMRGLDIAEETCITMNSAGMVAIQHIVFDKALSEDPCFVDYIFCCRHEESDDEDGDATTVTRLQAQDDEQSRGTTALPASQTTATTSTQPFPASSPSPSFRDDTTLSTLSRKKSRIVSDSKPEDIPASDTSSSRRLFAPPPAASRDTSRNTTTRRRRRHVVDDTTASDGSHNLLEDNTDDASSSSSDESEIAVSSPRNRTSRGEECSSPELVYGRQD